MFWLGIFSFIFILGVIIAFMFFILKMFSQLRSDLNQRLQETSQTLQNTQKTFDEKLDVFGKIQIGLGHLEEISRQAVEKLREISSLQELLRAPKFRGEVGETLLENILAQVLPKEYFDAPYKFKDGNMVDAVIKISKNLVPVDAKFPLENFKKMINASSQEDKNLFKKAFIRDVKDRIDEIASKYILTDEGTFDFALMYIPAESVYSEINKDEGISAYARSKKIIAVSPNTFYAYLVAICHGLRGLNIEKNVQRIVADLGRLQVDLNKFKEVFQIMGNHISDAKKRYDDAQRRLEQFTDKFIATQQTKAIESQSSMEGRDEFKE